MAQRTVPPPTDEEIDFGIPVFLEQLVDVLRLGKLSSPELRQGALQHGHELLRLGFTVSQVVHDYGDVCQAITELAVELSAPIGTDDFRTLNACLDDAIAVAVTQYAREKDHDEVLVRQSVLDDAADRAKTRLGYLAHELRNLLHTATLACDALSSGKVGIAGSTGAVLRRSLRGASDLVGDSLHEIRGAEGRQRPGRLLISAFMEDLKPTAALAAEAAVIGLTQEPVDQDWCVEADPQVLTSVVMNLLQNAFKFTRPDTIVILRVRGGTGRVLLEIEDRCGGLPSGEIDGLFRPFEQRSADRSGLGLGLSFSRWAIERDRGRIYARDLPGSGCVFTIDLPQCPALAPA